MITEVIMPALGMAQETGLILSWRKSVGDAVKAGEILMEVETDKAAMEVEAQVDGFLTEIRVGEGEDVPVGDVIATISETADAVAAAPAVTEEKARAETPKVDAKPVSATEAKPAPISAAAMSKDVADSSTTAGASSKILASPKARRLAAERGLDLAQLVGAGHPQPYHVSDVERLAAMPAPDQGTGPRAVLERIIARASVEASAFDEFAAFAGAETDAVPGAILAAFGAGSYRRATGAQDLCVQVIAPRHRSRTYADPDRCGLGGLVVLEDGAAPDLLVYDLTATRLIEADLAAELCPALTVAREGKKLVFSLTASPECMDDDALISCIDTFAGRLEEPLRHLL